MSDRFETDQAPPPVGAYPHARRAGNLLFLSGLGPRVPGSDDIPEGIEAQTRQLVANLDRVLASAGATREELVDITVFLTDMAGDFARFNEVYAEYFSESAPCRTTVEVGALPTPIAVEFKCIAMLPELSPTHPI